MGPDNGTSKRNGAALRPEHWAGLLPDHVAAELIERWSERRRFFHGPRHLVTGLGILDELGAGPLEKIAFWFHDAVRLDAGPVDGRASARLAVSLLDGVLPRRDVAEVRRLVLLTTKHSPRPDDRRGANICDADLSHLGASWDDYVDHSVGMRLEALHLSTDEWSRQRAKQVIRLLDREWLFGNWTARHLWEDQARANMVRELACLG